MTAKTYPLPASPVALGIEVKDEASGAKGVVMSILHKLTGSVMLQIQPQGDGSTMPESWYIDEQQATAIEGGRTLKVTPHGDPLVALGQTVEDRLTKLKGTVTAIILHLNGCVSVVVTPEKLHDGKVVEDYFDHKRLVIKGAGVSVEAPEEKQHPVKRSGGFAMRATRSPLR